MSNFSKVAVMNMRFFKIEIQSKCLCTLFNSEFQKDKVLDLSFFDVVLDIHLLNVMFHSSQYDVF